mmetsp:Transcript_12037/g.16816  ORF Transcript_12037/g.16816 Transcript_12037/m.16816 type:complete len:80 (-) Transcript_12037:95-334(-)
MEVEAKSLDDDDASIGQCSGLHALARASIILDGVNVHSTESRRSANIFAPPGKGDFDHIKTNGGVLASAIGVSNMTPLF